MILQIILILALIAQIIAAVIAIGLTRRTKFNAAWILFALGIVIISYQLTIESIHLIDHKPNNYRAFSLWSTATLAFCISIGIFYMRKILDYIDTINRQRSLTERRVLNTIISTEEKERKRFACDLHDGLGPLLSSAKMSLSVLSKEHLDTTSTEIVRNATLVVDEAIKEVRAISNNISPTLLQDFGVSRAINNFVSKISSSSNLVVEFNSSIKNIRYSSDIEIVLYRVGCEIVNNAIKHSQASKISITLNQIDKYVVLTINDNGIGLKDVSTASQLGGMGLRNITSRVEALGGDVDFITTSKGLKIVVKIVVV